MIYTSSVGGKGPISIITGYPRNTAQKLLEECWSIRITPKHLLLCENVLPCIIYSTSRDRHTKNKKILQVWFILNRKKQLFSATLFSYTSSLPSPFPIVKKFFTAGVSLRKIFRSLKLLLTSFFAPRTWLVKCWLAAYAQSTPTLQKIQIMGIYYCTEQKNHSK